MKRIGKYIASMLMLLALLMTTGCGYLTYTDAATVGVIGGADGPTGIIVGESSAEVVVESETEMTVEVVAESGGASVDASSEAVAESGEKSVEEISLDPEGSYTTCEDVALYLETYEELPDNFITKKEARELGWEGGSLEPYAPGMCIGGDKFGNYEGLLPKEDGRTYKECDIDTLGADSRGAKRIVYSNDGLIYYTEDHYESFILLYD